MPFQKFGLDYDWLDFSYYGMHARPSGEESKQHTEDEIGHFPQPRVHTKTSPTEGEERKIRRAMHVKLPRQQVPREVGSSGASGSQQTKCDAAGDDGTTIRGTTSTMLSDSKDDAAEESLTWSMDEKSNVFARQSGRYHIVELDDDVPVAANRAGMDVRPHPASASTETGRPITKIVKLALFLTSFVGVGVSIYRETERFWIAKSLMVSPKDDLRSFIQNEKVKNDDLFFDKEDESLDGIEADGFRRYFQSTCLSAKSAEAAQEALTKLLTDIPQNVRENLAQKAVIEGVSQKNAYQSSDTKLTKT